MSKEKYERVGISLFKITEKPMPNGDIVIVRLPWSFDVLRQDYGRDYIATVPKFDGFCTVPDHVNYQSVIKNFRNTYEPLDHSPKEGDCSTCLKLIRHIFQEHYELGLDYIQLLYLKPRVKLPVLLLISSERNTGKSTFLNFLKMIYGKNMTFNTNEDFRTSFNSSWTDKLLIGVDETLLNRKEDTERIKNLATSYSIKYESKGKDKSEMGFFAKFIFCSNNVNNAIYIEPGETRFWVREIPGLKCDDPNFLMKLEKEIPAFLFYIKNRTLSTKQESRMWFRHDLFQTNALKRMIAYNRNGDEITLRDLLIEIIELHDLEHIEYCINDLLNLLQQQRFSFRIDRMEIRNIVQHIWKLSPTTNNSYPYYTYQYDNGTETNYSRIKRKGRYYSVTKEFLLDF